MSWITYRQQSPVKAWYDLGGDVPDYPGGIFKPNAVDTAAGREQSPQLGEGVA